MMWKLHDRLTSALVQLDIRVVCSASPRACTEETPAAWQGLVVTLRAQGRQPSSLRSSCSSQARYTPVPCNYGRLFGYRPTAWHGRHGSSVCLSVSLSACRSLFLSMQLSLFLPATLHRFLALPLIRSLSLSACHFLPHSRFLALSLPPLSLSPLPLTAL